LAAWNGIAYKLSQMNSSIIIDSVFLDFQGVEVLRGINLEFKAKQITGLLGRNGCGKSCFLKIITGQIAPRSKHIKYYEKPLTNLYKKKGLINYLPQHEFHPGSLKLEQLIAIYEINASFFFTTYPFLNKRKKDKFSSFSGGERRMLELLLVLEADTKFSILDEPFSHIMPLHIELVKRRIVELSSRKGILITDHQYENVLDISDRLFMLVDGVLKPVSTNEDLRQAGYIR
jgi:ABC-type multidrug transport system ATPase subunit